MQQAAAPGQTTSALMSRSSIHTYHLPLAIYQAAGNSCLFVDENLRPYSSGRRAYPNEIADDAGRVFSQTFT